MRPSTSLALLSLSSQGLAQGGDDFNWTAITASKTLQYQPCYGNRTLCARLILPLDYKTPNDTRSVIVAITKYAAAVPDDHPTFGGSIFVNPGGPGGSATDFVRKLGSELAGRLETSGRRHYEYIGVDPRGIGASWPPSNCFPGDMFSRQMFKMESRGLGPAIAGGRPLSYGLALQDGFGKHCLEADRSGANGGPVMAYAGTAYVARDMVEVADRIEELRGKQQLNGTRTQSSRAKDVARIKYIGFSYGTVLGHYFASLFPERIERVVLDGVVNAKDYSTGPGWTTSNVDTDKIYDKFFSGCHQAASSCALARATDRSPHDIKARFATWLGKVKAKPLNAIGPQGDVRVLTEYDVRAYMGASFYNPIQTFQRMASNFDGAINGNTTALFNDYFAGITPPHGKDGCVSDSALGADGGDGGYPVICGDGEDVTAKDAAWWRHYARRLASTSWILGPSWINVRDRKSVV